MKLTEKLIRRKVDLKGRAVGFRIDRVRLPDGKIGEREYLDHPGAVAIIPLLPGNKVIMVRQFRYPVGVPTWEVPAGKLDKGEPILACAKRELEEETGYKAGRIWKLMSYWPTPAFANEIIHIYVATNLKKGTFHPDEDEFISAKAFPMKKLRTDMKRGRIRDSKTLIALMAYELFG